MNDLRFALRSLAKTPGFTLIALLSLAVGIGVNSTLFSALDAAFLRPLPFRDADEIVRVLRPIVSYPEFRDLRPAIPSLASLAAVSRHAALLRRGDDTEMVSCDLVSPDYFATLGIASAAGRLFSDEPGNGSGEGAVVMSYGLWQRRFGGDPHLVGQTITLNNRIATVVGVTAPGFAGDRRIPACDLWQLADAQRDVLARTNREFELLGRLKPGATAAQAQGEAALFVTRVMTDLPKNADGQGAIVQPETGDAQNRFAGGALVMAVVGLVLLVACANVSCLLLARHEERRREIAVRLALGGSRWRLMRQLLVESAVLAVFGAAGGLLLALWGVSLIPALIPPTLGSHLVDLRIDARVLGLTLGLALLSTFVFGLFPAWRATRVDVGPLLKNDTSPMLGRTRWLTTRHVLVTGQVAIALVFLAVAALFGRGFGSGAKSDFGFTQKNVLLALVGLGSRESLADCEQLLERLRTLPGVRSVSAGSWAPLSLSGGGATVQTQLPGETVGSTRGQPVRCVWIEPEYFSTLGIRLLRGRDFTTRDDGASSRVAIVNEAMVRRCWPGENPLGKILPAGSRAPVPREIVGVARDVLNPLQAGATEPCIYLPLRQELRGEVRVLVATQHDPAGLAGLVRGEIRRLEPRVVLLSATTMAAQMRVALFAQWAGACLGGVLGLLAFVLAVSGLYGVVAYAVTRRTREVGIRLALGARPRDALWLVLRQGLVLGLAGVALGLPLAIGAGVLARRMLFGVSPADPMALLATSVLVIAVALFASWLPARRATRVNPIEALRAE